MSAASKKNVTASTLLTRLFHFDTGATLQEANVTNYAVTNLSPLVLVVNQQFSTVDPL